MSYSQVWALGLRYESGGDTIQPITASLPSHSMLSQQTHKQSSYGDRDGAICGLNDTGFLSPGALAAAKRLIRQQRRPALSPRQPRGLQRAANRPVAGGSHGTSSIREGTMSHPLEETHSRHGFGFLAPVMLLLAPPRTDSQNASSTIIPTALLLTKEFIPPPRKCSRVGSRPWNSLGLPHTLSPGSGRPG